MCVSACERGETIPDLGAKVTLSAASITNASTCLTTKSLMPPNCGLNKTENPAHIVYDQYEMECRERDAHNVERCTQQHEQHIHALEFFAPSLASGILYIKTPIRQCNDRIGQNADKGEILHEEPRNAELNHQREGSDEQTTKTIHNIAG